MSKTIKITISLITLNLIVFGTCFYLFAKIKQVDRTVSSRLIQIESEIKKDESLRSIKNLLDETKEEVEKISSLFIQSNGSVDFIEEVESLGAITGIKLEIGSVGVDALKGKTGSSTESLRLSLKTEGSWSDIVRLLSLLENMPYKISFENLSFAKISGDSDKADKKKKVQSYWSGNFNFSVLKIKSQLKRQNVAK